MRHLQVLSMALLIPCFILSQSTCPGDVNNDTVVNLNDILMLLTFYGDTCSNTSESYPALQISEIHYNPGTEQGNDSDFEFLEIFNPTEHAVSLANWSIENAIHKTFSMEDSIVAYGFIVVARNADSLALTMTEPSHLTQWPGGQSLNNTGETIELVRPDGGLADVVSYEDNDGWVSPPDGLGPSLEWMDSGLPNEEASSWAASLTFGGTPGAANSMWGLSDPE